jgi:TonB family protein
MMSYRDFKVLKRSCVLGLLLSLLGGCLTNPNQPPVLMRGDTLVYPEAALSQGLRGAVDVRYDVAADGRVLNARVVNARPPGVFDEAALTAVRGWRFRPGRKRGKESLFKAMVSTIEFQFGESDVYPTR